MSESKPEPRETCEWCGGNHAPGPGCMKSGAAFGEGKTDPRPLREEEIAPCKCSCWLGTDATFGDAAARATCAVHGDEATDPRRMFNELQTTRAALQAERAQLIEARYQHELTTADLVAKCTDLAAEREARERAEATVTRLTTVMRAYHNDRVAGAGAFQAELARLADDADWN